MSILHYIIGLPPKRNGGSVQYAYDLMQEQAKTEKVFAMVCGDTLFRGGRAKIKKSEERDGFVVYSLTNPLTPTLIYGTSNPLSQCRNIDIDYKNIKEFIKDNNISILHLHTLMGLHKDIVIFIKSLDVKVVYTTHDFHGICSHYNLIDYEGKLCDRVTAERCALCNQYEPSNIALRFANSSLYHAVKKSGLFRFLSKPNVRRERKNTNEIISLEVDIDRIRQYEALIEYYSNYFNIIDQFHFNSSQTKQVFQHFLKNINGRVIPVITSGVKDRRTPVNINDNIQFGFIGSLNEYKGFSLLKKVLSELYNDGYVNFKLNVFSGSMVGTDPDYSFIEYRPSYTYRQVSEIMYGLDCIIVPSKWYETFSLVTLEALGHGRPVIVSNHVGAKDIVTRFSEDMIFSSEEELKVILKRNLSNPQILVEESKRINKYAWNFSIETHAKEILAFYNE